MSRRQILQKQFFGHKDLNWSDLYASDRIQLGVVEVILRDLVLKTLELTMEANEKGCLAVRPHQDDATFMTLSELQEDKAIAEGMNDTPVSEMLDAVIKAIDKTDFKQKAPILLVDHLGAKLLLVDVDDPVACLKHELSFSDRGGRREG